MNDHSSEDSAQESAPSHRYSWHRQTISETFDHIVRDPAYPWVAIGDFLDDWRRSVREDRLELVKGGIPADTNCQRSADLKRWAAFCAAMVEWLCWQDQLPFPGWTSRDEYRLAEPWFLYPGDLLRAWQLATTPTPFKLRNIYGGDRMLNRA